MSKSGKSYIAQGLEKLALVCSWAAALNMVAIVGIIVTSVLMRKLLNAPLHITEEVVGLMLTVSLFLGVPAVTLNAKHVKVSLIVDQLKGRTRAIILKTAILIGIIFFAWLIWEAVPWLEFAFKRNLKTETSRILLYPWMSVMFFSLVLTLLVYIARLFGQLDPDPDGHTALADPDKDEVS
ncbi:TRAP transporter small permease [Maritalea mediterranea]|uniref:TRAP transporter small permease protein n=1 Tax=Maritalea mediterranea TaxID=2909667 RepID=A0ABS9E8X7_9HYPH|nr:TRAP transporter small permease [Maritalea mediterranea]MCF4099327.1 TRAP transporter small permease [Maritalea mediterranea]